MAMGPSTTTRSSRTTKSTMPMPMPDATMLTGTPLNVPVCVTKPRVETIVFTGVLASSSLEMLAARPTSPTVRMRGATSPARTWR